MWRTFFLYIFTFLVELLNGQKFMNGEIHDRMWIPLNSMVAHWTKVWACVRQTGEIFLLVETCYISKNLSPFTILPGDRCCPEWIHTHAYIQWQRQTVKQHIDSFTLSHSQTHTHKNIHLHTRLMQTHTRKIHGPYIQKNVKKRNFFLSFS